MFPGKCVLLLLLALLSTTAALRCRECAYFRGESEDPGVGSVLERMNAGSKDICKDDPDRAGSLDCSEMTLREGYDEWRCVHRDNVMTAELNGRPLTISLISRDCEPVASNGRFKDDNCYHSDDMRQRMATLLRSTSPDARLKELHGHYCLCNTNNCNDNVDPHDNLHRDNGGVHSAGHGGLVLALLSVLAGRVLFTR